MRFAGYELNDVANAPGICVSVWAQGCPHRCKGCFNQDTWPYDGGKEFTSNDYWKIIHGLTANGVNRNFCLLGGEPLCDENLTFSLFMLCAVKSYLPKIKTYLWTGYLIEDLNEKRKKNPMLDIILNNADYIIDGPFIEEKRDISLFMMGSSNQRVLQRGKDY